MSESKGNVQTATQLVEVTPKPVHKTETYTWTVELFERQGKCWLGWSTNAPFRAQQGQIRFYADSFPSNPEERIVAWTWDDDVTWPNPFNTGKPWGSGWCAAWVAQKKPNGPYVYFVKTPVTTEG
ncbi:MAG: hypothetical protein WAM82_36550 [Thermoanaerobaculia bacterium]